jgi:hypothetical protein
MSGIARKLAASLTCALMLAATLGAAPAWAQAAKPQRVRGQIVSVDGDHLSLKGPDGKNFDLVLDKGATVQGVEAATLDDIKPGSFVGSAAEPEGAGWKALEVHIFPPGSRQGEGHRAWDPQPGATMTNADVTAAAVKAGDGQLTLRTGNQDYKLSVPPGTPIVKYVPGSRALLVPGNYVGAQAAVESQGVLTAKAITAGSVPWPIK